jgi:heme-degrading monooxygenase HmoA
MYARVSRYQGKPDLVRAAMAGGTPQAVQETPGFKGAFAMVDEKSGRVMTITLWESEQAMQDSTEKAKQVRVPVTAATGSPQPPIVETYEMVSQQ